MAQTATSTTLTISTVSGTVSTVSPGTIVTLTASVVAGSTPVAPGQVTFCDASAKYCEDIHILGVAQLTKSGTATLRFRPGVGSHSYKAVFLGTSTYAGSASSPAGLAVTGLPTSTALTSSQLSGAGQFELTATVKGTGVTSPAPTGTVSFVDTSAGNTVLGSGTLVAGSPVLSLLNPSNPATEAYPDGIAIADFNGDGIPDLAIANHQSSSVTILLGKGDGTFTSAPSISGLNYFPSAVVAGDFNGDGITDLAVAYGTSSGELAILLGNGDGTFTETSSSPLVGSNPAGIAIGDFNGDGNADLAVTNELSGTVTVLLGSGDGAFTAAAASPAAGLGPEGIAVADFNEDGHEDLAVADSGGGVAILLGNGDGTFTAGAALLTSTDLQSLVVADFNGDGLPDIAATGSEASSVIVLLGNGNGTFSAGPAPNGLPDYLAIAAGDFNGDGVADLAGVQPDAAVYLGKGDGTFSRQVQTQTPTNVDLIAIAASDLNGDGFPDLVATGPVLNNANQNSQALIQLMDPQSIATADISVSLSLGTHQVVASYGGDSNYAASESSKTPVANLDPTTLALSITPPSGIVAGNTVTLTATLSPFSYNANSTNGETVSFYNGNTLLGTGTLSGGVAILTLNSVTAGKYTVTAKYGGDGLFGPSTSSAVSVSVAQAQPTVTLVTNPTGIIQGQPVTLTATLSGDDVAGTNGESVYFNMVNSVGVTSTVGTGTINANVATATITNLPVGLDRLVADYEGDANNLGENSNIVAESVAQTGQAVSSLSLAVTISGGAVTTVAQGTPVTLTATATASGSSVSPGTVTFCDTGTQGNCGVLPVLGTAQLRSNGTASITLRLGVGAHSLEAILAGTSSDSPAASNLSPLTVTGKFASTTTLTSISVQIGNTFEVEPDVTVQGVALKGPPDPTGTVSVLDTSNGNALVGSAQLGLGGGPYGEASFAPALEMPATGAKPFSIAAGDFNGDGIPDLAVANSFDGTVGVLLGNGDGTFKAQLTYAAGAGAYAVAVGDFNGDGHPDLAVTNFSSGTVSILLGNGDGTFESQQNYATGVGPVALAAVDFNGDGILDLAVANQTDGTVSILLGKGDGTFAAQQTFAVGNGPAALTVADFNNDGKLDLAVANQKDGTVSILLGNGDGTFATQTTFAAGNGPISIASGDFNDDGYIDLAVADLTDNAVTQLNGNATGSFTLANLYTVGTAPEAVTAGNFSGQGNVDLAVANSGGNSVMVMVNNGTGIYEESSSLTYPVGAGPVALAAADWNGDGMVDIAALNNTAATMTALLNISGPSSHIALNVTPPGNHKLIAEYGGDANYSGSTSAPLQLNNGSLATTLTLSSSADPSNYGDQITLTATLTPYASGDVSTNGEALSFLNGSSVIGTGTLSSGVATLKIANLPGGVDTLTANFAGDGNFDASSANVAQTIRPAIPVIALSASGTSVYATTGVTFTARVSATAGTPTGTVSFYDGTTMLGSGTLSSGTASYATSALAAGPHSITAAYGGNTNFTAVTSSAVGVAVVGDFSFAAQSGGSTSATASPGGQATYMLSLSPPAGGTFPSAVTFSVAGLPAGATATFSPATVTAGSGATNVTLTIALPASSANKSERLPFGGGELPVMLGLVLLPLAGLRKRRRRLNQLTRMVLLAVGTAAAMTLCSCGGSSGGGSGQQQQQPQNYTLTVTAASGSLSNPITLTLTVE